ncbi:hypothetical protein MJN76_29940, partial [Salmonella enterica subsp. enterica serovar Anatum]|nr:hypothetical protein [Salmonella enterica subsp. enterica serovar Anatum]
SYALTGALVIVTGMVMGNIADYFHLPVSSMSNTFTFLNAGILGRVDRILVTRGNLVSGGVAGNATLLTTIVSHNPMYVYFDIDE